MSDYSVDSDSEDDDEVEDVAPRATYNSLRQHSRKQPSQERLPETRLASSQNTRNNDASVGPRQYQNQPSNLIHSNPPSDFDEKLKTLNFAAMTDTGYKQQQAEVNKQKVQSKLEQLNYNDNTRGGGGEQPHPHFPKRDYQQDVPSFSGVRSKQQQSPMHTSRMLRQPRRSENITLRSPSAYPSSEHQVNSSHGSTGQNYATGGDVRKHNQKEYVTQINAHQMRPGISPEDAYILNGVDFNKLREWSEFSDNNLMIVDISVHLSSLSKLLKQDSMQFEWIYQLVIVLKKIISVESQKTTLDYILKGVCESKFLTLHLRRFLSELQQQRTYPDTYGCFLKLVDVLEYIMRNLREYASHCNQSLQNLFEVGKSLNILSQENELTRRIQKLLDSTTRRSVKNFQTPVNTEPGQNKWQKYVSVPDGEEPPDRYQDMTMFPDTEELAASIEPFLRANKTKGAYRDLTHYLDIHSRLMKEDYLSPIRTGLKDFKLALQNNTNVREHDLRFYYNVKIAKISFESDQGITHFVHFDNSPFRELDWEYSKRLMFGSLLVFSKDNFESTIFATVASRDVDRIKRGILEVMFQNNLEEVFTSSKNDSFTMAETTAYFESYRHALEGLQEMTAIPLERYIISCMREILPPQYLHEDMVYNIASIMNNVYDHYPAPVLKDSEWPDADSTSLNVSQLEALKLALSHEIAIINGPPRTGKTYVGLKIVRIILENNVMKHAVGSRGPILVVCFTNHALDQFLEGILDFCQTGIVRVGRSASTLLENFNLKHFRHNPSVAQKIPVHIHEALRNFTRHLEAVRNAINRHWQETLRLETTILSVRDLDEEMSEKHIESLTDPRRETNVGVHIMSTWLKASNANMENILKKAAIKHLGQVIAGGGSIQNDSSLNNKKSAARTDFQTRVKIYHYWTKKYETFIEEETEKLLAGGDVSPANERKLQELMAAKDEISNGILRDDTLKPYMSDKVYEAIKGCVQLESKEEVEESEYVRHWLLNGITRTDQLLDAIEQMTEKKSTGKQRQGRGKIFADTEAAVHEGRWVIDDSDDADENTDESSNEDDENEGRVMDDPNDEERVKMSDIKELEDSYKQFHNREITMLQRAKMLGIDLTVDEDEQWQTANLMSYRKVFNVYHNAEAYTEQDASTITDLWSLQLRDRYRLYKYWVQGRKKKVTERLIDLTTEYKIISKCKRKATQLKDLEILKRAKVIGITTTEAAKHRHVLQEVGCRIIVVENAAEVLEAHIVTTLNKHCQHLILIGDHQQLRPSPTSHKLAFNYDLEISLGERLIKNNIPYAALTEQHRM
ncbi:hypothetical protein BsWGS_16161 [Bradybaena similaris]